MTLSELLSVLNTSVTVTVIDKDSEDEIIVFKAQGIDAVETTTASTTVAYWKITSASTITVAI